MNVFHDLKLGESPPEKLNMIVEIPTGCMNKYELDKDTGLIMLDRVNYADTPYPFEYGLVPQTWYDDNDPLDILAFTSYPTFPGCILPVRVIGLMKMIDDGEVDDKIVAVPVDDKRFDDICELNDIVAHKLKIVEFFFSTYKALKKEGGVKTEIKGWFGKQEAFEAVHKGIRLYKKKFSK